MPTKSSWEAIKESWNGNLSNTGLRFASFRSDLVTMSFGLSPSDHLQIATLSQIGECFFRLLIGFLVEVQHTSRIFTKWRQGDVILPEIDDTNEKYERRIEHPVKTDMFSYSNLSTGLIFAFCQWMFEQKHHYPFKKNTLYEAISVCLRFLKLKSKNTSTF